MGRQGRRLVMMITGVFVSLTWTNLTRAYSVQPVPPHIQHQHTAPPVPPPWRERLRNAPPPGQFNVHDPSLSPWGHMERRISLNFGNTSTRELIQIIAQFTGINFAISDRVTGSMSIHLNRVPWQQALAVILKAQGLAQRQIGEIILIAPIPELATYELQALEAEQKIQAVAPLYNQILRLKYANAVEIAKMVDASGASLLSSRGEISVDPRTNSLWIRDTLKNVRTMVRMISRLDFPVKQVMIEARIVTIKKPYEEQLGVRFGLSSPKNLSGTLEGANDLAKGKPVQDVPIKDRLNFDIPASSLFGNPAGSIGIAVAKLGNVFLDLELSALEREGHVHLISSPRLITSDQHPAYIKTGSEIPYQAATSSGATSVEFKDAVLKLEVVPHISPDNRITMKVKVTNNHPGIPVKLGADGEAIPIETEEEESNILVNDHQTVVLGGVFMQDKRKIITRIPFFGVLPLIGRLFTHTQDRNDQSELLIFLTPHIIQHPDQLE